MREHGPRPTFGELQRATAWVWPWCERCQHHAPLACAVAVIRWGPDASSDKLRAAARCTGCGDQGATVQHPGCAGNHIGFSLFQPTSLTKCAKSTGAEFLESKRSRTPGYVMVNCGGVGHRAFGGYLESVRKLSIAAHSSARLPRRPASR
jgi:hypothetical protein